MKSQEYSEFAQSFQDRANVLRERKSRLEVLFNQPYGGSLERLALIVEAEESAVRLEYAARVLHNASEIA